MVIFIEEGLSYVKEAIVHIGEVKVPLKTIIFYFNPTDPRNTELEIEYNKQMQPYRDVYKKEINWP